MRKNFFLLSFSLVFMLTNNLHASPTGKELFQKKCTSCHSITMPKTQKGLRGPPAVGIMFNLSSNIYDDDKLIEHIISYTLNPTREKTICKSVRKFGIMPSQKDNITKEELRLVAEWLVDDIFISRKEYVKQKRYMFSH